MVCPNAVHAGQRQLVRAGKRGARRDRSASSNRLTFSSCRTLPQVKARTNDPSVEGARIPANTLPIAPCRSTSMSSMQSAPAAIPATRHATFRSGRAPVFAVIWTWRRTSPHSPARSASDITGTSPARDTRFGSSKHAEIFSGSCNNRIQQVPF